MSSHNTAIFPKTLEERNALYRRMKAICVGRHPPAYAEQAKELTSILVNICSTVHFMCTNNTIDSGVVCDMFSLVDGLTRSGEAGKNAEALLTAVILRKEREDVLRCVLTMDQFFTLTMHQLQLIKEIREIVQAA